MEIYFDNSATTIASPGVRKIMEQVSSKDYGNPSSLHKKGMDAERHIRQAKESIARTLKAKPQEIIFTSGGTESDNLAILGGAYANQRRGGHLITTRIEHPAVSAPMSFLEEQGFAVTRLEVDKEGRIYLEQLQEALRPDTVLVSIMQVNNEIGAMQPIEQAAAMVKGSNPDTLFHTDAVQGYGKYVLHPGKIGIDLLSASGHKIHGPKGAGFLYVKDKTRLKPILFGGGQQRGLRPGTEYVPGIAGLGQAAAEAYGDLGQEIKHLYQLREAFLQGIADMERAAPIGRTDQRNAPHIVSVSFEGVRSEVLLHALEERGIYTSSGSACASNKPAGSETLKALGLSNDRSDSVLRFSFGRYNTLEEVELCLAALQEAVPMLRRYIRH